MRNRQTNAKGCSPAFSLVELLVVIGLIAALIAILLPVLGSTRERAKRTACLSNLRQAHLVFAMYAQSHRDQVPLGFRRARQFNSMLYSQTSQRFVLWGVLHQAGMLGDGQTLYCPSEANPSFQHDTPQNPWPVMNATTPPGRNIQAGYALRPETDIPDALNVPLPRLSRFKNRAIVADLTASRVRLDTRHRAGLNALFGDGSAMWIKRDAVEPAISRLPEPFGTPDPSRDGDVLAVWAGIDRR
jgi:prepilin-type processing-associated H-X9-DG protein